ncbi:MAG: apolipoprotein N-acyltransferase [Zoogloeaceae bacterium]|jgi:apolipoprotein N-acyltransferase|nr:apolipoprotein N-acyltransferase [Zoogloeaceae bacterium]
MTAPLFFSAPYSRLRAFSARLQQGRAAALLSALAGGLGVLSFAPLEHFWIMPFLLALLFHFLRSAENWRQAAWRATLFGLGLFLAGVSWVYVSMYVYGGLSMVMAALPTLLLCFVLAIGHPALGGLFHYYMPETPGRQALFYAGLWLSIELLRGWLFTGFPWLALGYSQTPPSPLAGFAPILGVYGVSFFTALMSACLVCGSRKRLGYWLAALCILLSGWGLRHYAWTEPAGDPVRVALIQGNVAQGQKWLPENFLYTLNLYRDLIAQHPAQLTILPETAIPVFYDRIDRDYLRELKSLAMRENGNLVMGVLTRSDAKTYWNSAVSLGVAPSQAYSKSHLVPFGEYAPFGFDWLLNIPMASFSSAPVRQSPLVLGDQKVAINICFEDLFGHTLAAPLPEATLLVNMSNTAWFGRSLAQSQQLQIARMRALETGRVMLRATNTGMTAVITPDGVVQDVLPQFTIGVLTATVRGYAGVTPYILWGDGGALLLVLLSFYVSLALPARASVVACRA